MLKGYSKFLDLIEYLVVSLPAKQKLHTQIVAYKRLCRLDLVFFSVHIGTESVKHSLVILGKTGIVAVSYSREECVILSCLGHVAGKIQASVLTSYSIVNKESHICRCNG